MRTILGTILLLLLVSQVFADTLPVFAIKGFALSGDECMIAVVDIFAEKAEEADESEEDTESTTPELEGVLKVGENAWELEDIVITSEEETVTTDDGETKTIKRINSITANIYGDDGNGNATSMGSLELTIEAKQVMSREVPCAKGTATIDDTVTIYGRLLNRRFIKR